jgi:WS/DGAT/MGAT family acyltransferase
MWQLDADQSLRFHIVGVVELDRVPDWHSLRERVEQMTRAVPRLRHRVVASPFPGLRPHWEMDPHFDLAYHLRSIALPEGGGESDMLHLASLMRQDDFPAGRPPWRMLLITGLPHGGAALVVAMHHVITDGVGAVRMAAELFDLQPAANRTPAPLPDVEVRQRNGAERLLTGLVQEADQFGGLRSALHGAASGIRHPGRSVRWLADAATAAAQLADPTALPGSPLPRTDSPAARYLTLQAPVDGLRAAATASGGKLNDAYLAALVGGLRRYHDRRGLPLETVVLTMPVNMRRPQSEGLGGNDVLLKIVELPAGIADPAERVAVFRKLSLREQTGGAHAVSSLANHSLSRLPGPLLRAAMGALADTLDVTTTNVPGVPVPLYLAEARVTSMNAFLPRGRGQLAAALLSYNGTAHIGLSVDPAAIPDSEMLADCIQEELDAILSLAQAVSHLAETG